MITEAFLPALEVLPLVILMGMNLGPFPARDLLKDTEEVVDLGVVLLAGGTTDGVAASIRPFTVSRTAGNDNLVAGYRK